MSPRVSAYSTDFRPTLVWTRLQGDAYVDTAQDKGYWLSVKAEKKSHTLHRQDNWYRIQSWQSLTSSPTNFPNHVTNITTHFISIVSAKRVHSRPSVSSTAWWNFSLRSSLYTNPATHAPRRFKYGSVWLVTGVCVGQVTSMRGIYWDQTTFNEPISVTGMFVSRSTDYSSMFQEARCLQPRFVNHGSFRPHNDWTTCSCMRDHSMETTYQRGMCHWFTNMLGVCSGEHTPLIKTYHYGMFPG